MASILGDINDFITSIMILVVLLVFFYGSNYQGWYAGRQLKKALKELNKSKRFGIDLITKAIEPFRSESLSNEEIATFIQEMLDFFVLSPSDLDVSKYPTLNFLHSRQESRYRELILNFIPTVDDSSLVKITSLLTITAEIDNLYKKVRHNLITGEKTKSYWYLLQSAADISTTMHTAQAYRHALTSFIGTKPIGDSVGPLTIQKFVEEATQEGKMLNSSIHEGGQFYSQKVDYQDRQCICLRAKGPESKVGTPGIAIQQLFSKIEQSGQKIGLFISVDAVARREGEKSGTVAHGLGIATGNGRYPQKNTNVDKYQIEKLIMQQDPPVPMEAIVCRVSFEEAFLPITETIQSAVPKILRFIKQIIRSQTQPDEIVVIIGIGNAIGVPL